MTAGHKRFELSCTEKENWRNAHASAQKASHRKGKALAKGRACVHSLAKGRGPDLAKGRARVLNHSSGGDLCICDPVAIFL